MQRTDFIPLLIIFFFCHLTEGTIISDSKIWVSVNYSLECPYERNQFAFTVTLYEYDMFPLDPNDLIKEETNTSTMYYDGIIEGYVYGAELDHDHDIRMSVKHNCGGRERKIVRAVGECHISSTRCDYGTEHFDLVA